MQQPTLDEAFDIRDDGDIKRFVETWEEILTKYKPGGRSETEQCQKFWIDLDILFTGKFDPKTDLDFEKLTAVAGEASAKGEADVYSSQFRFLAEQKSMGIDLDKAEDRQGRRVTPFQQAIGYLERLSYADQASIRTIVTSNFEEFRLYPLGGNGRFSEDDFISCSLEELPKKAGLFKKLFSGEEVRKQFSILAPEYTDEAAEKVSALYRVLVEGVESNQRLSRAKKNEYEEKIPLIVMRIVFLRFADNTSADLGKLFKDNQFTTFLTKSTNENYFTHDLMELFKCLNLETDEERVEDLIPEKLMGFPYVDGGLFEEQIRFPEFSKEAYSTLCDLADKFNNWDGIDVSVFGPVMDHVFGGEERRENGIYYTSKDNIQKVINPLFMEGLRIEFGKIRKIDSHEEKQRKLEEFHDKLSRLRFFDPACGSGNFLTEAFMEIRALEDEVIALESPADVNLDRDVKVTPSQFYGIELKPYAAMVARTALQIAREQALEKSYARFYDDVSCAPSFLPLRDDVRGIVCGNALTMDWNDVVTPSEDLFIFGNPPFAGDYNKSVEQQKELDSIFDPYPAGKLDYCAAWYLKSAKFLNGSGAKFAFVSTNSITQGVQVEGLFKPVFDLGWRISFAWPSVLWDHRDAAVYVVIIGFTQREDEKLRLYDIVEDEEMDWEDGTGFEVAEVKNISPDNLKALPTVFVNKANKPISELPCSIYGNKFADGGGSST